MASDPAAIAQALERLLEPDTRHRLLARGLARGMIWREGRVPEGGPWFSDDLTDDLVDFGYCVLALALELRDWNRQPSRNAPAFDTSTAFRVAAESIESAFRRGNPLDHARGLHLVVGAAAFHLAGYAARSFTLLPHVDAGLNLSSSETALALLLRRDLSRLREVISAWIGDLQHADRVLSNRLRDPVEEELDLDDVVVHAVTTIYFRALGRAESALFLGDESAHVEALTVIERLIADCGREGMVPMWWVATLTKHLLGDLWTNSLHKRLPMSPKPGLPEAWVKLREDFIRSMAVRSPPQLDLWPSQLDAASRAIDPDDDLIVSLPTSSGKTRIAELCILRAMASAGRAVYVTPLRALSAQVERTLARTFVPLGASVSSLYGATGETTLDKNNLASGTIVVATPEKLDFAVRQDPDILNDITLVVFDEGHMIGLGSREIRYEVLIQRLLRRPDAARRRIVCLSAMFNTEDSAFKDFFNWLRADAPGSPIQVAWRPTRQRRAILEWDAKSETGRLALLDQEKAYVPKFVESRPPSGQRRLSFPKNDMEFCIAAADAFARDGHNVLVYSPQRRQVEPLVSAFTVAARQGYLDGCPRPKDEDLEVALAVGREWLGESHPAVVGLRVGVGTHHGALPRPFLSMVEVLLNGKLLPIVVASPTLAQGIDLACSTLIFRSITRFDRQAKKQVAIDPAEFANVLGRAGRAYVDIDGLAVLPVFNKKRWRKQLFNQLIAQSQAQVLWSGLARLVHQISRVISARLEVSAENLLDYVANTDIWDNLQTTEDEGDDDDDESAQRVIEDVISDLDVAILSLVEPLSASTESLSSLLDAVLKDSLWERTLAHVSNTEREVQRATIASRARWLWTTTNANERRACFSSSLGQSAGVFLYRRMDVLVATLAKMQSAVVVNDVRAVAAATSEFAEHIMESRFFTLRKLPQGWREALRGWVSGTPFSAVSTDPMVHVFIQDCVVFKFVWAAEAVRVQAGAIGHARAHELGDGPALALTFGVPNVQAALLSQGGLASRAAAMWAVLRLRPTFVSFREMHSWLLTNDEVLAERSFWQSDDMFVMWNAARFGSAGGRAVQWGHRLVQVVAKWIVGAPPVGTTLRVVPINARSARLHTLELEPIGDVTFDFDPRGLWLACTVTGGGWVTVSVFGPERHSTG